MDLILAKKIKVSRTYHPYDWYKSEKSRMHILALVYASKSFLAMKQQPHSKAFMAHLESIVTENPNYAQDCEIDDVKWADIQDTLKAMWRKFHKNDSKLKSR